MNPDLSEKPAASEGPNRDGSPGKRVRAFFKYALTGLTLLGLGWFGLTIFNLFWPADTKVPDPRSTITITISAKTTRTAEVTDPEDAAFLRHVFGRPYATFFDAPSCPFEYVTISFARHGRRLNFSPAADGCNLILYGRRRGFTGRYFDIPEEDMRRLDKLWKKY